MCKLVQSLYTNCSLRLRMTWFYFFNFWSIKVEPLHHCSWHAFGKVKSHCYRFFPFDFTAVYWMIKCILCYHVTCAPWKNDKKNQNNVIIGKNGFSLMFAYRLMSSYQLATCLKVFILIGWKQELGNVIVWSVQWNVIQWVVWIMWACEKVVY